MEAETITGEEGPSDASPTPRRLTIDAWGVDWAPLDGNGELVGDVAYATSALPYP